MLAHASKFGVVRCDTFDEVLFNLFIVEVVTLIMRPF